MFIAIGATGGMLLNGVGSVCISAISHKVNIRTVEVNG